MTIHYADDQVTLHQGDCREILPALEVAVDCIVADPPYGETSLDWDDPDASGTCRRCHVADNPTKPRNAAHDPDRVAEGEVPDAR